MTKSDLKLGLISGIAAPLLEENWSGTLTKLQEMGYRGLELSGGVLEKQGMTAKECRSSLADHGFETMSYFSGWGPLDKEIDREIDTARALGCQYIVWGWSPANDQEEMKKVLPVMHKAAGMIHSSGLQLIYHNHDHEFLTRHGDVTAFDWLLNQFHPDLLQCELDIGWVVYGGQDISATIRKHANRCPILHLRDIRDPETRGQFIEVGEGIIDLKTALQTGLEVGGSQWGIVEHTKQLEREPLEGLGIAARNLLATGCFG